MSMLTTHGRRESVDLGRFVFSAGRIGCLKVLDSTLVQPGDSYECDMVGSFNLAPLRRGLALDTKLDIFTFYTPIRHVYPAFTDFLAAGPYSGLILPKTFVGIQPSDADFLGMKANKDGFVPAFYSDTYFKIFNNYFKNPTDTDLSNDPATYEPLFRTAGLNVAHLKDYITAPLTSDYVDSQQVPLDGTSGVMEVHDFALTSAHLHTIQERALFAHRYRDLVDMLGGKAPYDTDNRPQLIQRTETWASGWDVDATDSAGIGQSSGRTHQAFNHKVPRFFCREHGVIMTLIVPRFPPVHAFSRPFLAGHTDALDYNSIVHDPAIAGVGGQSFVPFSEMFSGGDPAQFFPMPFQHHMRVPEPHHVDERYSALQGFPFLSVVPPGINQAIYVQPGDYDDMFQTDSLLHWNTQIKTNVRCYRSLVTARDSLTNDDNS